MRLFAATLTFAFFTSLARAGYEQPCFIDGCQSIDGRYVVTAEPVGKITNHGPNKWKFVWKDTKTGETRTFDAKGVQGGQIFGQLYIAPNGETFALFNHLKLWTEGKSNMHGTAGGEAPGAPKSTDYAEFTKRVIAYSAKDGSIIGEVGAKDVLKPEEWNNVMVVFNRVHWIVDYPGLSYRKITRPGYALHQVSPDYTVLEVLVSPPRGSKAGPRPVRIDLTTAKIIPEKEWPTEKDKVPVRPFVGEPLPAGDEKLSTVLESFVPSLDPVRTAGTFKSEPKK